MEAVEFQNTKPGLIFTRIRSSYLPEAETYSTSTSGVRTVSHQPNKYKRFLEGSVDRGLGNVNRLCQSQEGKQQHSYV